MFTLWSHSDVLTLWSLLIPTVHSPDSERIYLTCPQPTAVVLVASVHRITIGNGWGSDLVAINALSAIKWNSPSECHIYHSFTS